MSVSSNRIRVAPLGSWRDVLGAASVMLTEVDLDKIERAAAEIQVEGERYPPQLQAMVGR